MLDPVACQSFIGAIVETSIQDLKSTDYRERRDAYAFWSSRSGKIAKWRRHLLSLLSIDDETAREALIEAGYNINDMPEPRPRRRPSRTLHDAMLDAMPDGLFSADDLAQRMGVAHQRVRPAMQTLLQQRVVRVVEQKSKNRPTQFAKTEWLLKSA